MWRDVAGLGDAPAFHGISGKRAAATITTATLLHKDLASLGFVMTQVCEKMS
jgi:hypothetical protein